MPLVPFMIGQKLDSTRINAALDIDRTVYQVNDQSVISSTVLVNSANLTLSVATNSVYVVVAHLVSTSATAADINMNFAIPAGALVRFAPWSLPNAETVSNGSVERAVVDSVNFNSGGTGVAAMVALMPIGYLTTAGTAGSFTLQFAQRVSTASNTTLKSGSWLRLIKVA